MKPTFLLLLITSFSFAQNDLEKGIQLQKESKYQEAKLIFERVLKSDPNNAEANCRLGQIYLNREFGDLDKAIEHCKRAVEINVKSSDYHYWLGEAYWERAGSSMPNIFKASSFASKAKEEHEKAIKLNPKYVEARLSLYKYYMKAPSIIGGGINKAKRFAEETLQIDESTGRRMKAAIHRKEKNFSLAEEEYKKAILANPKNVELYNIFGYFYIEQNKYDEAISQFKKYVELEPTDPNGHDSLAEAYFEKGLYDEALSEYKKSLEINPKFTSSVFGFAKTYQKKDLKDEAVKYYKQCINIDPNSNLAKESEKRINELMKN
jgi:tetratricopeptide (TPR) repeat protein